MKNQRTGIAGPVVILLFLLLLCLSACSAGTYTKEQAEEEVRKGTQIIEAYLKTLPEECSLIGLEMAEGRPEGNTSGKVCASHIVSGSYTSADDTWKICADTETGEIWTDRNSSLLNRYVQKKIEPYCEKYGFTGEIAVTGAAVQYKVICENVPSKKAGKTLNAEVILSGVLPAGASEEEVEMIAEAALLETGLSGFCLYFSAPDFDCFPLEMLKDFLTAERLYRPGEEDGMFYCSVCHVSGEELQQIRSSGQRSQTATFLMTEFYQGISTADTCELYWDYYRHEITGKDGIYVNYVSLTGEIAPDSPELQKPVKYEDPVSMEGNTLYYRNPGSSSSVLFFREEPAYGRIIRVNISEDGSEGEKAECTVIPYGQGFYTLTDPDTVPGYGYLLFGSEKLIFEE